MNIEPIEWNVKSISKISDLAARLYHTARPASELGPIVARLGKASIVVSPRTVSRQLWGRRTRAFCGKGFRLSIVLPQRSDEESCYVREFIVVTSNQDIAFSTLETRIRRSVSEVLEARAKIQSLGA